VASVSVGAVRGDIITYIRVRLSEDGLEAMDKSLVAGIPVKIPENISDMYLAAIILHSSLR